MTLTTRCSPGQSRFAPLLRLCPKRGDLSTAACGSRSRLSEFPRNKAREGLPPVDDLDEAPTRCWLRAAPITWAAPTRTYLRGRLTATPLLRHERVETRSSAMEGSAPVGIARIIPSLQVPRLPPAAIALEAPLHGGHTREPTGTRFPSPYLNWGTRPHSAGRSVRLFALCWRPLNV
jgi:hypothetical protein